MRTPNLSANLFLRRLQQDAPHAYADLERHLAAAGLESRNFLATAGDEPRHTYFVESGVVSVVAETDNGESLEIAFIGLDGLAPPVTLIADHRLRFSYQVQVPGKAWRISADRVHRHVTRRGPLAGLVLLECQYLGIQAGRVALCTRAHSAEQRLARWLLTMPRRGVRRLDLTHEFLASMIGTARSMVSGAAARLRASGAIEVERGRVRIADMRRLQDRACECAAALEAAHGAYDAAVKKLPIQDGAPGGA